MIKPIKGTFKSYFDYVKKEGHNDKELDPNQYTRIETEEKVIYLTFDTCPSDEVEFSIINWLVDNKIPATIFLNVEWYKRNKNKDLSFLSSDQFTIGGHGYNHVRPTSQNYNEQNKDINSCVNFIYTELGKNIKWYRCPHGKPNEDTINILEKIGIKYASWAGHVFDKSSSSIIDPNKLSIDYVKNYTKPGDIWIFHINGEGINTIEMLKESYTWALSEGYRFEKL